MTPTGVAGPSVAVVICTRNRPSFLAGALAAVSAAVRHEDEVLIVDSASDTPETASIAAAAGFPVLRVSRPGLSRARNAGVAATTASLVAFTDDDCLPEPGWTRALALAFADPDVGVVFGRLVPERVDGPVPSHDPGEESFGFDAATDTSMLGAGACMAFRRKALEAVGGFDEALGAGTALRSGEDHDIAWRVLHADWTGRYEPGARVVHREWRNRSQLVRMHWAYGLGAGAVAAKLISIDRRAGWLMLGRRLGHDGLAKLVSSLARRWKRPALEGFLYSSGVVAGAARMWSTGLRRRRDPESWVSRRPGDSAG